METKHIIPGQKIGYIRVSTEEQNTNRQLDGIELHRIFMDKCSGKDTKRPQLEQLINFVRTGDQIYVHSMDRLARNLDDLRALVNKFTSQGVKIIFVKENLTFSGEDNSLSKLLLSIMGAFAEFERELIKERQREGINIAKKNGKYKGRKKVLTDEQVAELKSMAANRYKKTEIAEKFGISRYCVYSYLAS